MSYALMFDKKYKAAKDVDFKKIASEHKIAVPAPAIATFKQKTENTKQALELLVEVDREAGKYRMVIKKLTPSDITIDWTDPEARLQKDAVATFKQEMAGWGHIVDGYLNKLKGVADRLKVEKDHIKTMEAGMDDPQIAAKIANVKGGLERIGADANEIKVAFDSWYSGPRAGVLPLLKKFKIDPAKLEKADEDHFHLGVMDLSKKSTVFLNEYQLNVDGPVDALLARLENLRSVATKSKGEALAEVRKNVAAQLRSLGQDIGSKFSALKLESTVEFGRQFQERKGPSFEGYKDKPKDVAARVVAVKNQIASADGNVALIDKTADRIISSIPPAFQRDGELMKLGAQLSQMTAKFRKDVAAAQVQLAQVNTTLEAFFKQPARPAGPPGGRPASGPHTGQ